MLVIPVVDIKLVRGDDKLLELQFSRDDVPIDITGWTVFFTMKLATDKDLTDASAILKKNITSHTDPTNGITQLSIDHEETAPLDANYIYDIQTKDTLGKITTVLIGQVIVEMDITRRITV